MKIRWSWLLLFLLVALGASTALAQAPSSSAPVPVAPSATAPAATAAPSASAVPSATAAPSASAQMPPGHPPAQPRPRDDTYRPPGDKVLVDETTAVGTIDVEIRDADDRPIPNYPFKLHIKFSSVTKGDSVRQIDAITNAEGSFRFENRDAGTGIAYSVIAEKDGAVFRSQLFGLKQKGGIAVQLHVFETTSDLLRLPFVMEATVLMEIQQGHVAINHRIRTLNLSRKAFVPNGIAVELPEGWSAFNDQEQMGGDPAVAKMVERDGQMVLTGTFRPGTEDITFRYQVDLTDGDDSMHLVLPLPPRTVSKQVILGAGPGMNMVIAGFPKAEVGRWNDGKRVLHSTMRPNMRMGMGALLQDMSPQSIDVTITGIPTRGNERWWGAGLALIAGLAGIGYLFSRDRTHKGIGPERRRDLMEARDRLLGEMVVLEKAHARGDVGPRSYERLRKALLDAIGRIVAELGEKDDGTGHPYRGRKRKRRKKKAAARA